MPAKARDADAKIGLEAIARQGGKAGLRAGMQVQRLFEMMVADIVSGAFAPGAKLNEPELARRFGVSRGPLREAFRRLEERQLVVRIPNAGARVIAHTPEEILEAYDIREALEGLAARLAAHNMDAAERGQLRHTFEDEVARGTSGGYGSDFHMQIVRGAHNRRLSRILNEDYYMLFKLWRANCRWLRFGGDESWSDHSRILEAIEHGDGECAEILMRRHIGRLRRQSAEKLAEMRARPQAVA